MEQQSTLIKYGLLKLSGDKSGKLFGLYANWADKYDSACSEGEYQGPQLLISQIRDHLPADKEARILDVGCGTGLSGLALRSLGYTNIDGIDGSEEMVEYARQKGVYRNLFVEFIEESGIKSVEHGVYSLVFCCAAFCPGHVGPHHVGALVSLLAPGGIIGSITRAIYLTVGDLTELTREFQRRVESGQLEELSNTKLPDYLKGEDGYVHAYRKLL